MQGNAEERFWAKVAKDGPVHRIHGQCWIWMAAQFGNGRGHFSRFGREQVAAHVFSLELKLGRRLLPGMNALHRCDNGLCVNPDHLWEGTQQENILDMMAKGRGTNQWKVGDVAGERNVKAKVTEDAVRWIRKAAAAGMRQKVIGAKVGLTQAVVSKIVRRVSWRHVA